MFNMSKMNHLHDESFRFSFHLFIYFRKNKMNGQGGQNPVLMITGLQLTISPMVQNTAFITGD